MKTLTTLMTVVTLSMANLMASDESDVAVLTKNTIDNVIKLLRDKTLTNEVCKKKVQKELLKVFDLPLTAKLTLGRRHWPKLTAEQRKIFQELFIKQLINSYFDKAKLFSDQTINYEEPVRVKRKIHAAINCVSKGEKIRINNKFYKSSKGWRVYDLEIQGISIVRSYGSQYAQILKDGTVDDLLKKMRKLSEPKK